MFETKKALQNEVAVDVLEQFGWNSESKQPFVCTQMDGDEDGEVGTSDLLLLLAEFGLGCE